jgi:hypothetical protein
MAAGRARAARAAAINTRDQRVSARRAACGRVRAQEAAAGSRGGRGAAAEAALLRPQRLRVWSGRVADVPFDCVSRRGRSECPCGSCDWGRAGEPEVQGARV